MKHLQALTPELFEDQLVDLFMHASPEDRAMLLQGMVQYHRTKHISSAEGIAMMRRSFRRIVAAHEPKPRPVRTAPPAPNSRPAWRHPEGFLNHPRQRRRKPDPAGGDEQRRRRFSPLKPRKLVQL